MHFCASFYVGTGIPTRVIISMQQALCHLSQHPVFLSDWRQMSIPCQSVVKLELASFLGLRHVEKVSQLAGPATANVLPDLSFFT